MEGDHFLEFLDHFVQISIHALRVEGDVDGGPNQRHNNYFYPRPPGGGRHKYLRRSVCPAGISIHALRVEGDPQTVCDPPMCRRRFLSTPSGWRATAEYARRKRAESISIHALRVEGDQGHRRRQQRAAYFYPRPPGGGRLLSVRISSEHVAPISIHALRVEGDSGLIVPKRPVKLNFYPRPPGGGRRRTEAEWWRRSYFYPRPPGGGRPRHFEVALVSVVDFYPRPPGGGRPPTAG